MKLIDLIKNDDSIFESLKDAKKELKKFKTSLNQVAEEYQNKYDKEIQEGTRKKQLLIQEGISKGMDQKDALKYADSYGFVPTVRTPILNLLHFLKYEYPDVEKELNHVFEQAKYHIKRRYSKYDDTEYNLPTKSDGGNITDMEDYIYKNMNSELFQKLKKLKALSKSSNDQEAFLAYRKCMELCKKFNLDFDRIPNIY